jgi:hypothetical protein
LRKIFFGILLAIAIFLAAFWTDSGRAALFDLASYYLKTKNATLIVEGTDKKLTKIQKIFVRATDGSELAFSDITLDRESFFAKSDVRIGNFSFNSSQTSSPVKSKKETMEFGKIIALARTLKIFIKSLSIEKGILRVNDKTYSLNDLSYKSEESEDFLSVKIDGKQRVNAILKQDGECELTVEDFFGSSGKLIITRSKKYELAARNDKFKVISDGSWKDFTSDIKIENASLEYQNVVLNFTGNLYLSKRKGVLQSQINLEYLMNSFFSSPLKTKRSGDSKTLTIPDAVLQNFKNVAAHVSVDLDFAEKIKCRAEAVFKRSNAAVGKLNGVYEDNRAKIFGDIGWISVYGFDFSKIFCEIDDKKRAKANLTGKDFEIISEITLGDRPSVEKFELKTAKGFVKSANPFFLSEGCSFDFNFSQLDFWNKIIPVSGGGSGKFSYKNGAISGNAEFSKLSIKDCDFRSLKLSSDGDKINLTAKNASLFGVYLKGLALEKSGEEFKLTADKLNESGTLQASGKIADSLKKISLTEGKIAFLKNEIKFESCVWDATSNKYKIRCVFKDKRKSGEAEINFDEKEAVCAFSMFPIDKFMRLFNRSIPSCRLGGNLKLKSESGNFIGEGRLTLTNLIAHKRNLEIYLKAAANGVKIDANMKNGADFLDASFFLPIALKNDGSIERNVRNGLLNYRVRTNARLERFLELPDYSDLRGRLECDFRITGSFANPTVLGTAKLTKAYIGVGGVVLKNGSISLVGNGKTISVLQAEFIDYKKKKATVSGGGKLFFDGILPNINTDLKLSFNDFALFDSDDLKIDIRGEGTMSGPIDDMIIRGNVVVPRCEIQDFASVENEPDITIENDPCFAKAKDEQKKKDFFRYDVSMRGDNIKFAGNIFEMLLKGDLLLSTYEGEGTLIGELKLADGKLDLFGKRMKFTSGKVEFLKEFPFNPKANFKCQRNFGDISVGLDIQNSPTKGASLRLYSTPSYSQDVILSQMLFGKESKYLTAGEAAQLANALASFNRRGYIFSVLNAFQNIGMIDNISFANGDDHSSSLYVNSQTSTQNDMNVSAGKYIDDNVYISVNKREEKASFDIDFSITPRVSIKANTIGEAGLSWKHRY